MSKVIPKRFAPLPSPATQAAPKKSAKHHHAKPAPAQQADTFEDADSRTNHRPTFHTVGYDGGIGGDGPKKPVTGIKA